MNWEGGIAFNASFGGFLIVLLVFSLWLSGKFEKTRQNHSNALPNEIGGWEWFSFNFDEQRVGSSGSIYLRYFHKLILSSSPQVVLAIIMMLLHYFSDNLGESPNKTLRSLGINNIGSNGIHSLATIISFIALVCLMNHHGKSCKIKSLASPSVPKPMKQVVPYDISNSK